MVLSGMVLIFVAAVAALVLLGVVLFVVLAITGRRDDSGRGSREAELERENARLREDADRRRIADLEEENARLRAELNRLKHSQGIAEEPPRP